MQACLAASLLGSSSEQAISQSVTSSKKFMALKYRNRRPLRGPCACGRPRAGAFSRTCCAGVEALLQTTAREALLQTTAREALQMTLHANLAHTHVIASIYAETSAKRSSDTCETGRACKVSDMGMPTALQRKKRGARS